METKSQTSLKEDILVAARYLLVREGYDSLSMRKIARRVGCKAASIYYHFKNKDEIIEALVEEGVARYERMASEIARRYRNPFERFEALLWTWLEFGLNNPAYFELFFMTAGQPRYHRERLRTPLDEQEIAIRALYESVALGLVRISDPYITYATSFSMLSGVIAALLRQRFDPAMDPEKIKRDTVSRILESIRA